MPDGLRTQDGRGEPGYGWAWVRSADAASVVRVVPAGHVRAFVEADDVLTPSTSGEPYWLIAVTVFAHLSPRDRPAAYCPACLERVWMKLGSRKRHHYAHAAKDSRCAAARAEGELHLSAKILLADGLRQMAEARLEYRCGLTPAVPERTRCGAREVAGWVSGWDGVEVEHSLPSLRADIMLTRGGRPLAAMELYASHSVDDTKARKYRGLGIPWIEVPANGILAEWGPRWHAGDPVPVTGDDRLYPEPWRCPRHQRLHAAYADTQRNGVHRVAERHVHLYRTDGGISAGELRTNLARFSIVERRQDGRVVEAWLERDDRDSGDLDDEGRVGDVVRTDSREEAERRLHATFRQWAAWYASARGARLDSPMHWQDADASPGTTSPEEFPQRFRWEPHASEYVSAPNLPSVAWPPGLYRRPEHHAPDPVLGYSECFWTRLPPRRDRRPQLNAILGNVWVTLEPDGAGEPRAGDPQAGRGRGSASIAVHRHDGTRWVPVLEGARIVGPPLPPREIDWGQRFAELARTLASGVEDILAGTPLEIILAPVLRPS